MTPFYLNFNRFAVEQQDPRRRVWVVGSEGGVWTPCRKVVVSVPLITSYRPELPAVGPAHAHASLCGTGSGYIFRDTMWVIDPERHGVPENARKVF